MITIAGGTGFIGKKLAKSFKDKGLKIGIISRDSRKAVSEVPYADDFATWETSDLKRILNSTETLINLSGASLADKRWTEKYKKIILESRTKPARIIAEIIQTLENPPKLVITASGIGIYGNTVELTDESSPPGVDFLSKVCVEWEKASLIDNPNIRQVNARMGVILDKKEGAFPKLMMPFKFFTGAILGSGKQWMPWIHIDDLVMSYHWIIQNEKLSGPINLVSNNPVTMSEFAKVISRVTKRPILMKVPEFLLNTVLGEQAMIVTKGQNAIPRKLMDSGFNFSYKELEVAIRSLI
ncbi:MAG: TIGR01777 family oxidoreductase [Candidatus Kapabacteria bacterium]|nr:TIGR01777 family oxidoreductase [Candidatus Kapabacteria bacterium]